MDENSEKYGYLGDIFNFVFGVWLIVLIWNLLSPEEKDPSPKKQTSRGMINFCLICLVILLALITHCCHLITASLPQIGQL